MKKLFALILIGLAASAALAQVELKPLMPPYWVAGTIQDTPEAAVGTRPAYVFYDDAALLNNEYGESITFNNQYMVNAFAIFPAKLEVGKSYRVATEQDEKGYGADTTVAIIGTGWDRADMAMRLGGGIKKPGVKAEMLPWFEDIRFGNRKWQPAIYGEGKEDFIVSAQPKIKVSVVSQYGLKTSSISMVQNEGTPTIKTYTISAFSNVKSEGAAEAPTRVSFEYDFVKAKEVLEEGKQKFTFRASNVYGTSTEVVLAVVGAGDARIIGTPITYPSPVRLSSDRSVTFQYTLSNDANIDIFLFDISGRVLKKLNFARMSDGGSAGVNKPAWDLISDQGTLVGSGICVFNIVSRDTGRLLGKGKFTAVP